MMSTRLRLLILEDDPYDAELQVATLEKAGYACQWERVETRAEFLTRLAPRVPGYDLILADYGLPAFDGLAALKLFLERDLDVPFILVSSTPGEETATESLKAGATDYVLKDRISQLGPVVQRALRETEEQRRRKQAQEALQRTLEQVEQAKQEWEITADSLSELVCLLDAQGRIIRTNRTIERWGLGSVVDAKGREIQQLFHPDWADFWQLAWAELLQGRSLEREMEDGHLERHLHVQARPILTRSSRRDRVGAIFAAVVIRDITARKRVEEALQKRTYELGERVKELNCLYAISNLLEERSVSLESILEGVVNLVPPAWQYPEITCARLVWGDNEFRTENFRVTAWGQTRDIIVHDEPSGAVQVYYLEKMPQSDEGPFLQEERGLIDAIAERLGRIIERVQAEEALWQYTERLSILYAIDQAILGAESSEEIAQAALQRIGQLVPCMIATVTGFNIKAKQAITLAQYHKIAKIGSTDGTRSAADGTRSAADGTRSAADGTRSAASRLLLKGSESIIEGLRRGEVQVIKDILGLNPLPPVIQALAGAGVRAYISVPLIVKDELIGSLSLGSHHPDAFTSEHIEIAREVATQLAIVLHQARLHEQVERHAVELEQRVSDRTRELQTLYDVAAVAGESLELQIVLDQSLEQSLAATGCQAGAIQLLDEEGETLQLAAQQGVPPHVTALMDPLPVGEEGLANWVVAHDTPLVVHDVLADPRTHWVDRATVPFSYVGVPLRVKGKAIGVLSVVGKEGQQFSAEEVALLTSVADHVAVAVENARLRRQAEQAAVLEERARLARELHDSVTQLLYSLSLFAETGRRLAGAGEWQSAEDYLDQIGQTAQQALKEMRTLVHELRPPVLEQVGLVGALQQRLDAVERRIGVEASLLVEGTLELPVTVEQALYHIAQEALNNALRHASATLVRVHIRAGDDCVKLEVADDGGGFGPDTASDTGGMGLIGMRERVERLGGELAILSAPGEGTIVKVTISMEVFP